MSQIENIAERIKLARLLGQEPDKVEFLASIDATALGEIRARINRQLFESSKSRFQRVKLASKLLPNALVALIGEKVFGAMLCARIAGMMPPERAADIATRMSDSFLAEVSVELDPASAREVIARIPTRQVAAVAAILVRDADFVTMGRFVDVLSRETIQAVISTIKDDAALLRTAFFVEDKSRLNDLVELLPIDRIRRIVVLAGHPESDLWTEALGLMSHVDRDWKQRIGDMAAEQDSSILAGLAETANKFEL